ncbi:MAG: bifunctional ADP-dependent NAD(P)H-hydrate dehydratase/NAD(P)H-hydrate epimerase, partial [Clostridia bacterium]|nr:bifunctional ADP-dependent NAD(P)H-hydrate dehydratase/NAD(P)H-hydrate epimerase [Clostridia bacterium]
MRNIIFAKSALEADKKAIDNGTPSLLLMERAARGMLDCYHYEGRTAIVCGVGNNGGDGYALAYLLGKCDVYYTALPVTD